ncbi:MAG: nitrate- and nitrite sensing domain-containing protein [Acidobacteria bacterium]|nr:nitrate- and nitrite sensing domain-containing protein [Acidobacteriota bacterium]
MSIRARTYILVILPLAGLAFFVIWGWRERSNTLAQASRAIEWVMLLAAGGESIHAIQLERGRTAAWLAGLDEHPTPALLEARRAVDGCVAALRASIAPIAASRERSVLPEPSRTALAALDSVAAIRLAVDGRTIAGPEATASYTRVNAALLELVRAAAHQVTDARVAPYGAVYTAILRMKEAAGVERAILVAALTSGTFPPGQRDALVAVVARQDTIWTELAAIVDAEAGDVLAREADHPAVVRAQSMRERALREGPGAPGLGAEPWFDAQSARIDHLRELEHGALADLKEAATGLSAVARRERTTFGLAGVAIALLTLVGAAQSARSIRQSLGRLHQALEHIGAHEGTRTARLEERGPSELASIARAFNRYAERLEGLLERLASSEAKFARYATELERSNAELEQFAYVASHDLQEPLRMVASYTQLLGRRYQGKLDRDADEFIGFAVEGVTRMRELINDLLAYSRVGRQEPDFEPTDLRVVVERALANLSVAVSENGAAVSCDDLPTVRGDKVQLTELFQNLIGNALKFRRDDPPRIRISAARDEARREWAIAVCDNGIGMEHEHLERIFLIFQRLHSRRNYPGTGIGLAIAKKIVERHGGRIWAESEPGRGSTFHFAIPDRS